MGERNKHSITSGYFWCLLTEEDKARDMTWASNPGCGTGEGLLGEVVSKVKPVLLRAKKGRNMPTVWSSDSTYLAPFTNLVFIG